MKQFNLEQALIDKRFPLELRPLLIQLQNIQRQKTTWVKKQQYDQAALARDDEKLMWELLRLKIEETGIEFDFSPYY